MVSSDWTVESLKAFEQDIADEFNAGNIRAPVHLSGGNEEQLILYFNHYYKPGDWVASTWRSHYHCLLAGVPAEDVKASIMRGKSITLCFPQHRLFSSAIVSGHLPVALGIALGIKRSGGSEYVHAFCGDMASKTGIFHEVIQYASGHALPLSILIEDNKKSVCTDTYKVWGKGYSPIYERYIYELPWPHSGAGKRVNF